MKEWGAKLTEPKPHTQLETTAVIAGWVWGWQSVAGLCIIKPILLNGIGFFIVDIKNDGKR